MGLLKQEELDMKMTKREQRLMDLKSEPRDKAEKVFIQLYAKIKQKKSPNKIKSFFAPSDTDNKP